MGVSPGLGLESLHIRHSLWVHLPRSVVTLPGTPGSRQRVTVTGPRVVIVGGGFGGLACARALNGKPAEVLLVDRRNYHLFTPLLYQVATALLNPSDVAYPYRTVFRRSKNVRFRQATVAGVDLGRRTVRLHTGEEVGYDALVLATGSTNAYFGNPTLAAGTVAMKTLDEALRLRNHALSCLERAAQGQPGPWLTFVIVGAGPTGVEYAGALVELFDLVLGRDFPEVPRPDARVVLVEGADRVLPAFDARLGAYAARVLEARGVEVRAGTLVDKLVDDRVTFSTGEEVAAATVVWSAGVRATDPVGDGGTPRAGNGRLRADPHLRLEGHPDVYVIGDAASVAEAEGELPMLAPPAMQEGRYVARAIVEGRQPPFRYRDKGTMATIGRSAAVVQLGRLRLTGFLGWITWLVVHLYYVIGFRNRLVVLASWAWDYLRHDRPIRLIVRSQDDPVVAGLLDPKPD
jgi:NADH:quinone reductase (non-electrogenic)